MALHAEILVDVRHVDGEPQLSCHRLPIGPALETMGVMAYRAGYPQIVLRSRQVPFRIPGGDPPRRQRVTPLVAGPAGGGCVLDEGAVFFLQRYGVGGSAPLLLEWSVESTVAVGAAPGQRGRVAQYSNMRQRRVI